MGTTTKTAETLRTEGNKLFACGKNEEALESYKAALNSSDQLDRLQRAKLYSNTATVHLKLCEAVEALQAAEMAIAEDNSWWRGHQRAGDALVKMSCYWEAERKYNRAKSGAPSKKHRNGIETQRKACFARLYAHPAPNMAVVNLLQEKTRSSMAFTRATVVKEREAFWESSGLAKLVQDNPRTNILHATLLQALRITHPGVALRPDENNNLFAPRELGHIFPPNQTSFVTDLSKFEAYTPMGYCFEICSGFLAALQKLQPNAGWVGCVMGAPMNHGHAMLYSSTDDVIFDPLQLGRDPAGVIDRYMVCVAVNPQWSIFDTPKKLIRWIGEYRSGDSLIPRQLHAAYPGAPLERDRNCIGCQMMTKAVPLSFE